MTKPVTKKTEAPSNATDKLWFLVLAASLLFNAYFFFNQKDKAESVLASSGNQTFRWRDVSATGQKSLQGLDQAYYLTLKREAEQWAENIVLPKEAAARGVTVDELINAEVFSKVQVSTEEAQKYYSLAPSADAMPYPGVLAAIQGDLRAARAQEARDRFIKELTAKHGVQFKLKPPKSQPADVFAATRPRPPRFPVYVPPPAGPGLDAKKHVTAAPSRGAAGAPVVLEVYSDFECPFSKKFSKTLHDLEAAYPEQVRTVFRHFPLPMHAGAPFLHEASVCAQEQGKFWKFHDRLMGTQEKQDRASVLRAADELGLDAASFQQCLGSPRGKAWVSRETAVGKAAGVTGTPGFLINGRRAAGALPFEQLKPIVDWYLKPEGKYPGPVMPPPGAAPAQGAQKPGGPPQNAGPRLDPAKTYSLPADWLKKGASKGPANAPVTVVEFFDYNCPFCKNGAEISEQILAKYGSKVRVAAKHLPLPMHPNAQKTSEALLCANNQGKFWEFRKELFGDSWGKNSPEDLKAIAKKAGLQQGKFDACLDQSKMKAAVEEDLKIAQSVLGGTGTPTFVINGTPVVGAQPIEQFQKVIDEKLSGK